MAEGWVTTQQAGNIIGVSQNHVRLLIKQKKIKAQKFGFVWMVDRQSVEDYANSDRRTGPKSK